MYALSVVIIIVCTILCFLIAFSKRHGPAMFLSIFSGLAYFHYAEPGSMLYIPTIVSFVLVLVYLAFFAWIASER